MAFDARETFKDNIEQLDAVMGSRIVPDGAPDIYNAVTSYLSAIAQQIEENKDNPDKLKDLQSLALSITETYFTYTGKNGGNNDIANLTDYMQSKLKTIFGENSTVTSKYPELTAKIKEITTPEPVKEPQIISLEANAEAHAEYQALTGNEARRQFVANEFKSGKFSDPSHIDFFLEQYSKDEILINSDEDKKKLEALFGGIDGYTGAETKMQNLADRIVKSSLRQTVLKPGMTVPSGTIPTPDMMETKDVDLGLSETLKKMDKAGKKDDIYQLIDEANKEAIRYRYDGGNNNLVSDYAGKIRKAQSEAKWYQFKRKRALSKSLKGLTPQTYWDTKIVNGTALSSRYYRFRKWLAGDRTKDFQINVQKLNNVIELRTQDASMRWMSTNFWKKLKTKASLLFEKSPEKLTEKLLKDSDKARVESLMADLNKRLSNLPEATTKLENRGRNTAQELLKSTLKTIGDYPKTLDKQKADALKDLQLHTTKAGQQTEKFKKGLEAHVAQLREKANKTLQKDPQYLAYVKLHGEKAAKEKFNVEKMITTDKVMDEILKAQGYSTEEIKEIKQKLGMNEKQEEKKETKEEQTEEREDKKASKEIHLDSVVRDNGKPVEGYEATNEAKLNVSEDGSRYDFITTDKDGKPRDPSKEEIEKMVSALPKDAKITLEDSFSAGTQKAILEELEKQGIAIEDKEKALEQIQKRREKEDADKKADEERRAEEEKRRAEEKAAKQTENPEKPADNSENSGKPAAEGKEQMSMAKVMESIANDPENAEKKIKLLAEINKADLRVQDGEKGSSDYAKMLNEISDTFGKDSDEAKFLRSMVTNKSMEQELASAGFSKEETAEYAAFIKENASSGKEDIKANTQQRLENISQVTDLANSLKGKTDKEIDDVLKESKLPAYAKQGVSNLIKLENSDLKPEEKGRLRGQILGHVIEGKAQSKTVTKTVQRTMAPRTTTAKGRE